MAAVASDTYSTCSAACHKLSAMTGEKKEKRLAEQFWPEVSTEAQQMLEPHVQE